MKKLLTLLLLIGLLSSPLQAQDGCVHVASSATGGTGTAANPLTGVETAIVWSAHTSYCFDGLYYTWMFPPNWNLRAIKLYGGGAKIKHTGTGPAMKVDNVSMAAIDRPEEILIQDFHVIGNAQTTDGLYLNALSNSVFRNIWVTDVAQKAFDLKFVIGSTFDNARYSVNSDFAPFVTVRPQFGYYLTFRNTGIEPTEANTFISPVIEGATVAAIFLESAKSNRFIGGTLEANSSGIVISTGSDWNSFLGQDLECNNYSFVSGVCAEGSDVQVNSGVRNEIIPGVSQGTVTVASGATSTLVGGKVASLVINSGANGTMLLNSVGSVTDNSDSTINVGVSSPLSYRIAGSVFSRRGTNPNQMTLRPTTPNLGFFGVSPNGSNMAWLVVHSTDDGADINNDSGFAMVANPGSDSRLISYSVGSGIRRPIAICANQSTPNASTCAQLKFPTDGGVQFESVNFSALPASANGTMLYCPDCTQADVCAGGGTGAFAKRVNSAWKCN